MSQKIGPYETLKEIGIGGFATVYLAVKESNPSQQVALKVLYPFLTRNPNIVKRFRQEAKAAAKLGPHDHIIKIYGMDEDTEPPFIAMEYIAGGTLRDKLQKDGPLSIEEGIHIIKHIGEALAYAHVHNIIHRDVSPKNILLDTSQKTLRPVLSDFGLVKLLVEESGHSPVPSTRTGMGTYEYMAPEQWSQKTPSPATDIYALAITCFEILSGQRPFEADSPFDLREKHTKEPLPSLSMAALQIGPFFDKVLQKAAEKEQSNRYQNAMDFVDAIERAYKEAKKYEILEKVADGGMSTLYKARHLNSGTLVALKVLKSYDDVEQVRRFEQEARIVAALDHPNIIKIIEITDTRSDDQVFCTAMEFIEGESLRDRLESSSMDRNEVVHIIRCVGAALNVAHQYPVVHRDIKPENILLDTSQEILRPVLSDFGSIKVLSKKDPHTRIISQVKLGTGGYIAPEQLDEETIPTVTVDIYALAIIFFEMLTGQHPFKEDFPFPAGQAPALSNIVSEVGPFFDDILIKAMDEDPSNRYQNVSDFIEAIEKANEQAEQAELRRKCKEADEIIKKAQTHIKISLTTSLSLIEDALNLCPTHAEAWRLKGKIQIQQGRVSEAFQAYERAYQEIKNPLTEIGQEYLEILEHQAELAWKTSKYSTAVKNYEKIWHILDGVEGNDNLQKIAKRAQERSIEYHIRQAEEIYAGGQPEDLSAAIELLEVEFKALDTLKATEASTDLANKLKNLQTRFYKTIVVVKEEIVEYVNKTEDSQRGLPDEDILNHYQQLDESYQALIRLEPENTFWAERRLQRLEEQVKCRYLLALKLEQQHKPDYKAILQHYRTIYQIERTTSLDFSKILNINLTEKIKGLEGKVQDGDEYRKIQNLVALGEYEQAKNLLLDYFIKQGNYSYPDALLLLWMLSYREQHNELPTFSLEYQIEALLEYTLDMLQSQVTSLKVRLEPWSNLSEVIKDHRNLHATYQAEVKGVRLKLDETEKDLIDILNIGNFRRELDRVDKQMRAWLECIQNIEENVTAEIIKNWCQEVEESDISLQTFSPSEKFFGFFERIDNQLSLIKKDPIYQTFQAIIPIKLEVERSIHKIKTELLTLDNQQKTTSLYKAAYRHKLNKFITPLAVISALIIGGVVSILIEIIMYREFRDLSILAMIAVTGVLILVGCYIYYVWTYKLPK